ncbi:MAG: O-linked N-acetylglucosamine transferase, SPINDLY family protein [Planctomycetota bacterium]|jgi:predicted O-linked N-acetylglucosamine transferase (SPINDLY family)
MASPPPPPEPQCIQTALQFIQQGDRETGLAALQETLRLYPDSHAALTCMGMLAIGDGQLAVAEDLLHDAIQRGPTSSEPHYLLACAYRQLDRLLDAESACRRAIDLRPDYPEAHTELCAILYAMERTEEAIAVGRHAIHLAPNSGKAFNNLGMALIRAYAFEEAETIFSRSLALLPNDPTALRNRGRARLILDRNEAGRTDLEACLQSFPEPIEVLHDLALANIRLNRVKAAHENMKAVLSLDPDNTAALTDLLSLRTFDDVDRYYKDRLEEKPSDLITLLCRAHLRLLHGRSAEAAALFLHCIELYPDAPAPRAAYLMAILYGGEFTPKEVADHHRRWGQQLDHGKKAKFTLPSERRTGSRPLRIGYLSADLRRHSVAYFLEPILAAADTRAVRNFCYYESSMPDATTLRLREYAQEWRDTAVLDDEALAALIQADEIDILVELGGYTSKRMPLLAMRIAPIQITYCGYPNTTGLINMDYRIVDEETDPFGTEPLVTESLLRLPGCFLCFHPPTDAPATTRKGDGKLTLGSLNNISKLSAATADLWARILHRVPNADLLLKSSCFDDPQTRDHISTLFTNRGIAADRLRLLPYAETLASHLEVYQEIDIALDTFPYHGTTTTFEALYMGVGVVTLEGDSHISRVGVSILKRLGLEELIAKTHEEYVEKAVALAGEEGRRRELRESLRSRMESSPLLDGKAFTHSLEAAYREVWKDYCRNG